MPDLFFYRDPEEAEKEERERQEAAQESQITAAKEFTGPSKEDWGGEESAPVQDWAADGQPVAAPAVPAPQAIAAAPVPAAAPAPAFQVTEDWAAQTETSDWAAQSGPAPGETNTWGGSNQW